VLSFFFIYWFMSYSELFFFFKFFFYSPRLERALPGVGLQCKAL
jgi:hypothetical protein